MTVAHVYGTYVARRLEGISGNVEGLVDALRGAGLDAELAVRPVDLADLNRRRELATGAWNAARAARAAARRPATRLVHLHVSLPLTALAAGAARRSGGPPVVVHAWNAHAEGARAGLPPHVAWRDRWAHRIFNGPEAAALGVRFAPEVVVASRYQARQLRGLGYRGRVHRVPNGVDTTRFAPAAPTEKEAARFALGVDGGDPVILYYGHASPWKGLPVLLDALPALFRQLPRAKVLLSLTSYGQAAEVRAEAARRRLADRVVFCGPGDVPRLHAAADLAVLPAVAGVGTACYPNVLLECMAGGVPVVATRVGCVPEVVQEGRTGLLARPGDAADLAARLAELGGDAVMRRRMAAQGRLVAERQFAWPTIARRMLAVYGQLLPPESLPAAAATPAPARLAAGAP